MSNSKIFCVNKIWKKIETIEEYYRARILHCGHYYMSYFPFNVLLGNNLINESAPTEIGDIIIRVFATTFLWYNLAVLILLNKEN